MAQAGKLELVTADWLRRSLDVSPDAFALEHVVQDVSGCFRELELLSAGPDGARLRSTRAFASRSLDTLGLGAVVMDRARLRVLTMNHAFARLFSLEPERVSGLRLAELLAPVDPAFVDRFLARASHDSRVEVVSADGVIRGKTREVAFESRHVEHTGLALVLARDVSEPSLSPIDTSLRADLLASSDGVAIVDAAGLIVFANPGLHRLFGHEPGALLGQPLNAFIPASRRDAHENKRAATPSSGALTMKGEGFVACRRDGSEFTVSLSMNRIEVDGQPLMLCFVRDLARRQQSSDRLSEYHDQLRRTGFEAASSAEQERRRLATELHDGLGQSLVLARLQLKSLDESLLSPAANSAISQAMKLLEEAAAETRAMTFELSPPVLYDLGLGPALSWLVEDLYRRHGLMITYAQAPLPYELHEVTAAVLFRSVRELLMNTLKHAGTVRARLAVSRSQQHLLVTVEDDGSGFDASGVFAGPPRGFGLFSIREQLARVGGVLEVDASPGRGASVKMRVTLPSMGEQGARHGTR